MPNVLKCKGFLFSGSPGLTGTAWGAYKMLQTGWLPPKFLIYSSECGLSIRLPVLCPGDSVSSYGWEPLSGWASPPFVAGWASSYSPLCIPAFRNVRRLRLLVLLGCCVWNRLALGFWFRPLIFWPAGSAITVHMNSTFQKRVAVISFASLSVLVCFFLFPLYYHCSALWGRSVVSPPDLAGSPQCQPVPRRTLYC